MNDTAPSNTPELVKLVQVPAILARLGVQTPSISSMRNDAYSAKFPTQLVNNKLMVRTSDLDAIAKLYGGRSSAGSAKVAA